jgi:predicted DNA-binding transcriptional regulator AlpA
MQKFSETNAFDRLLSANDVKELTGRGHTWLYGAIKTGAVPKPRKIGRRNVWRASEISDWMASLPRAA